MRRQNLNSSVSPETVALVTASGLFDLDYVLRGHEGLGDDDAIAAYLKGDIDVDGPNALFSDSYYLEAYPDIFAAGVHPLLHYIEHGSREGRSPSPLFQHDWYLATEPAAALDARGPLAHFLTVGREGGANPNPLFDGRWYRTHYPDTASVDSLDHYCRYGAAELRDPGPNFSTRYYRSRHPALLESDQNPLAHCLADAGRRGERHVYAPIATDADRRLPPGWHHLLRHGVLKSRYGSPAQLSGDRPIIAFGTHEMSRTGAPLIVLKLIKWFSETGLYEIVTFADRLGELQEEFLRYSHVVDMSRHHYNDINLNISDLIAELGTGLKLAICNTANLNHISGPLRGSGVPVISLVHEMLYVYPVDYVQNIYRFSDVVIFPSQFVRNVADARSPIPHQKAVVLGQGLLEPGFGKGDRDRARIAMRREFGFPEDAPIVLGCGTVNIRKGVDLFLSVARYVVDNGGDHVKFVWLGSETVDPSYAYWMRKDLETSALSGKVHFAGEKSDTETYYLASDVFAMTSREDPFPCVIHEAMACGLPTIAFADAGGAPEALEGGSGSVVPYRDVASMGAEILRLLGDRRARDEMARAAKERVQTRYRFDDYAREVLRIAVEETGAKIPVPGQSGAQDGKPRVLFFARDWWISGVNSFTETLCNYLNDNGVEAILVFPTMNQSNRRFVPEILSIFLDLEGSPVDQWKRLSDFIESQSPCIIIPNYDYFTSAITPTLSDHVGSIGIIHSDDVEHYDHLNRLGRYWNQIVCSNNHLREEAISINPSFAEKIQVIPYGVTIDSIDRPAILGARSRIRLVYCGRLTQEQKRVRDLLAIVRDLQAVAVPFELTVIGDGDQYEHLKLAWKDEIANGVITMSGRLEREETYQIYARSDVFLLVSAFEGMPIALIEAMACGCVPIVTDIASGIPDLVTPTTGFKIPVGDTKAFAAAIKTLVDEPHRLLTAREASIGHIRTGGFTAEAMGAAYLKIVHAIWKDITEGTYRRPSSLNWRSPLNGVSPPAYMFNV